MSARGRLTALWGWAVALGVSCAFAGGALASVPVPDVLDADDPTVLDDLALVDVDLTGADTFDEDVVLAAQKVRTTIQEAPSIITVITRKQIMERGYRTVNDVIRTVPGFEGDRWEGNGWHKESFARGLPRTVLVLVNGVNINEPIRNHVNLDRKIPLEMVDRIEVTSGPGGVLWGSNALLGVINIVTRRPEEGGGVQALVGFGDGPGDRLHFKGHLGYSERFGDLVGLSLQASVFSTQGPELVADVQKVIGSLPEPAVDGPTLYVPNSVTTAQSARSWYFNFAGRLEIGPVALDWMIPFEQEYRTLATGGAVLSEDYLTGGEGNPTGSADSIRYVTLSFRDRFLDGELGINARAYFVQWQYDEDPFGVYPASPVIYAQQGHQRDLHLHMGYDLVMRPGLAIDVDWRPADWVTLVAGAEGFMDYNEGVFQNTWLPDSGGQCPEPFKFNPNDPHLSCKAEDLVVADHQRLIGGVFANAEFTPFDVWKLNAGVRLQVSDAYDPAPLGSVGTVINLVDKTHLKLFYSAGLRPPSVTSTHARDTVSGVSFQANPDLGVETSHSVELELNTKLLRDVGPIRDLYLRANAAYTLMDNVIKRPGGTFQNSGSQDIWTAEAVARLRFHDGHELWANYTFTRVEDEDVGRLLNIAEHMGNIGGKLSLLGGKLELTALLTLKAGMTDANRPPVTIDGRPDYSMSCAAMLAAGDQLDPSLADLAQVCLLGGVDDGVWVMPGTSVDEQLRPLALLDVGVRVRNIWRDLTVGVFVHNALNYRYFEPDYFNDPRVLSRPQPKPGFTVYGQVSLGL